MGARFCQLEAATGGVNDCMTMGRLVALDGKERQSTVYRLGGGVIVPPSGT